jgi:hypothetical protein
MTEFREGRIAAESCKTGSITVNMVGEQAHTLRARFWERLRVERIPEPLGGPVITV